MQDPEVGLPPEYPAGIIVLLVLLQAGLSVVLLCMHVFYFLDFGFRIGVAWGAWMHVLGVMTSTALGRFIPRLALVWALAYGFFPAVMAVFAAFDLPKYPDGVAFGFWFGLAVTLTATSFLGATYGVKLAARKMLRDL